MRRKISIGLVERMLMSTVEKFGGAAVREAKTNQVASFQSMYLKMMKMTRGDRQR